MGKRKTDRATAYSDKYVTDLAYTQDDVHSLVKHAHKAGHRANRISAAQRRVVAAALEWVKPPLWSGDATKAGLKLASAVDALQRAKGGANG